MVLNEYGCNQDEVDIGSTSHHRQHRVLDLPPDFSATARLVKSEFALGPVLGPSIVGNSQLMLLCRRWSRLWHEPLRGQLR